jgi:hypothetical protein
MSSGMKKLWCVVLVAAMLSVGVRTAGAAGCPDGG